MIVHIMELDPSEYQRKLRMIAFFWEKAPGLPRGASPEFPAHEAQRQKFMSGFEMFKYVSV